MSNNTHRGNPSNQLILPPKQQEIMAVEFDGFLFPAGPMAASAIYLGYKARRGDADAAAVLNGLGVGIIDLKRYQYWPMVETTLVASEEKLTDAPRLELGDAPTGDGTIILSGGKVGEA